MDAESNQATLEEKDFLALLEVIRHLHACRTRQELRAYIRDHLLPFFNAQAAGWGWLDYDFSSRTCRKPQMLDGVGIPEGELEHFEKVPSYQDSINREVLRSARRVFAYEVDFGPGVLQQEIDRFLADHPDLEKRGPSPLRHIRGHLVATDPPDMALAMGFHRLAPNEDPFSYRDMRLLELLCPHLIPVMKTIALNEELQRYQSLTEVLAEVSTPLALVSWDHRVLFRNEALADLLPLEVGRKLPRDLSRILQWEAARQNPPYEVPGGIESIPWVELSQGTYRVQGTILNEKKEVGERGWVIKLKPAGDPYLSMTRRMQEVRLTPREMEVAVLVRDGMDDSEIAARLFIQPSTVQNHLKCIFRKMNVSSRPKLMAGLTAEPGPEGKKP